MGCKIFCALAFVGLVAVSYACSPDVNLPSTTVEKVNYHDIVLKGQVTSKKADPRFPATAYMVDMTVECVIKSNVDINDTVRLNQAGAYAAR